MFSYYSINGYWLLLVFTLLILLHLFIERYQHNKRLRRIKYRIHVNGTRGKSSVSRLIAAGLRSGNIATVCKTTGTMARFIKPDGKEESIYRIGRTNIIEQVKVIKKAAKYNPEALVIECMAVQPLLQSICERKLVQSTHGVCVNARADHLDVMGPTERDVALALAGTMTIKGKYYTPETRYLDVFKMAAKDRGSELVHINDTDISTVSDEEIKKFSYSEYKDNVALALKVCEACGVSRDDALKGMWEATPDPGALTLHTIVYKGKKITLANGFAANDPDSTSTLWQKIINETPEADSIIGLVNCRADRGDRSRQMAEAIVDWQKPHVMMAIGSGTDYFLKNLDKSKLTNCQIVNSEGWNVERILDKFAEQNGQHILAIGVCNIAQIGLQLVHHFSDHEEHL